MVRAGLAWDCRSYSGGRYAKYETAASKLLPLPGNCLTRVHRQTITAVSFVAVKLAIACKARGPDGGDRP